MLRVPVTELVRLHASSGTHGKPTVVGYTAADLEVVDRADGSLHDDGGRAARECSIHNANTYGLFTGGHGFHQGAERIGAPVLPASGGFTARQAMLLHDLGAQVLVATPRTRSSSPRRCATSGIDPAALKLELGLFGGEPWTDGLRGRDRSVSCPASARSTSTVCRRCAARASPTECLEVRDGLHVHEDHFLVEVVDPESGEPLGEGVEGELVFTTLLKEAMPLLRYRTADIASLNFDAVQPAGGRPRGSAACAAAATT